MQQTESIIARQHAMHAQRNIVYQFYLSVRHIVLLHINENVYHQTFSLSGRGITPVSDPYHAPLHNSKEKPLGRGVNIRGYMSYIERKILPLSTEIAV